MRILITGAAGSIGRVVMRGMAERGHAVRGLDLRRPEPDSPGELLVGDCLDAELVASALRDIDGVVHLAGIPDEASLPEILRSHVETTASMLDGMSRAGVARFVYASSNHAVGHVPRVQSLPTTGRPRPDTFYGVGKVAAEALCSLYADRYGIGSVCCRIGSFRDRPASRRQLSTWLSHGDAVRMVDAALTAAEVHDEVIYGISANTRRWWDLEPGRALGYHPEDDAERFAAEILAVEETETDRVEASVVGGPFAGPGVVRRPFDPA
ncbi:MAG: NAD-dependent epimerase/dehydratase family protein [Propionibacteriales bacterium]|nr:NAD-dependent epimerase/dehydratase family protein [Propionibacteriales bacterium]